MIRASCPVCWRRWEFEDSLAGQTTACQNCGTQIPVPNLGQQELSTRDTGSLDSLTMVQQEPQVAPLSAFTEPESRDALTTTPPAPTASLDLPIIRSIVKAPGDSPSLPAWAIAKADAALRTGLSVAQIEQLLLARGLSPELVPPVIDSVLEKKVESAKPPLGEGQWGPLLHWVFSLVVECVCLVLAYRFNGGLSVVWTLGWSVCPLSCILFAESFNSTNDRIVASRLFGWIWLILLCAYRIWMLWLFADHLE